MCKRDDSVMLCQPMVDAARPFRRDVLQNMNSHACQDFLCVLCANNKGYGLRMARANTVQTMCVLRYMCANLAQLPVLKHGYAHEIERV